MSHQKTWAYNEAKRRAKAYGEMVNVYRKDYPGFNPFTGEHVASFIVRKASAETPKGFVIEANFLPTY
jgi:hypothetical protein